MKAVAVQALERDVGEESGWKLVHGDVFRAAAAPGAVILHAESAMYR